MTGNLPLQSTEDAASSRSDHRRQGGIVTGGAAIIYRLYDVGYEIHLEQVQDLMAAHTPDRAGPTRGEAQAIQIKNPPITVTLGSERVQIGEVSQVAEISARIFDFGVVSLRARLAAPPALPWSEFTEFCDRLNRRAAWIPHFARHLQVLNERIRPAIERPAFSPITEDYAVFRLQPLTEGGARIALETLTDDDLVPLLLNERRPLSQAARQELLPHRFSYYSDDLAVLTWDNALVIEPVADDRDIEYVLEFANAQLLELRVYDGMLDGELPKMYDRVARARTRSGILQRRYAAILAELQTLVADSTEVIERVQNALKVTDDVYLARIYSAALEIFREREWRKGIDRKLTIIRETYEMLNAEAQAARAEALEVIVVILIFAEILLAVFLHR